MESIYVKKAKKKQVKDELDRIKQAEKKRRRLEKALATSAAIRSELERKKLMKKEEQRRLDEEGAAIAEAVALHVLLGEDADQTCRVDQWDCDRSSYVSQNLRACSFESMGHVPYRYGTVIGWSQSCGQSNGLFSVLGDGMWGPRFVSDEVGAANGVSLVRIEDVQVDTDFYNRYWLKK